MIKSVSIQKLDADEPAALLLQVVEKKVEEMKAVMTAVMTAVMKHRIQPYKELSLCYIKRKDVLVATSSLSYLSKVRYFTYC